MSNLVCPFCQQELKYDAWNEVYMCRNPNCKHLLGFGTKELWQELIRARKALDVAKDALKNIGTSYPRITDIAMQDKANKALEQITAPEQKDVK